MWTEEISFGASINKFSQQVIWEETPFFGAHIDSSFAGSILNLVFSEIYFARPKSFCAKICGDSAAFLRQTV